MNRREWRRQENEGRWRWKTVPSLPLVSSWPRPHGEAKQWKEDRDKGKREQWEGRGNGPSLLCPAIHSYNWDREKGIISLPLPSCPFCTFPLLCCRWNRKELKSERGEREVWHGLPAASLPFPFMHHLLSVTEAWRKGISHHSTFPSPFSVLVFGWG